MKIRKWQAVLTATIATMTLSGPAMAEHKCSAQIEQLRDGLVQRLSCNKTWDDDPIWQFQGGKGKNKDVDTDGCSIHEKLSALIYEKRTEEPPKLGGKKGKGNNLAKGAVNDLIDHKFQSAIDQLQLFQDTIEYRGLIINYTQQTVLRLAAPLTIAADELDQGLDILLDVLKTQS